MKKLLPTNTFFSLVTLTVHETQAIANLVFFITYIIFQPPSTILIRAVGPRRHLSTITFLWGVITLGMGFTKNHAQLSALRAILGIFEAGFFPSAVYLLSTWYTRCALQPFTFDLRQNTDIA